MSPMRSLWPTFVLLSLLCAGCAVYQAIADIRYPLHGATSTSQPTRWSTTQP